MHSQPMEYMNIATRRRDGQDTSTSSLDSQEKRDTPYKNIAMYNHIPCKRYTIQEYSYTSERC